MPSFLNKLRFFFFFAIFQFLRIFGFLVIFKWNFGSTQFLVLLTSVTPLGVILGQKATTYIMPYKNSTQNFTRDPKIEFGFLKIEKSQKNSQFIQKQGCLEDMSTLREIRETNPYEKLRPYALIGFS